MRFGGVCDAPETGHRDTETQSILCVSVFLSHTCNAAATSLRLSARNGGRAACLTAAIVCSGLVTTLGAWGPEAHQAIAILAEQRLSPAAKAAVRQLLNGQSMASVATWADEVRDTTRPDTYNWHFVNIPSTAVSYDARRDCQPSPRGDCIIAALDRLEKDLGNRSLSTGQRRETLMFIIHLVGDLHQPLHAIDNNGDLGGNRRNVETTGGTTTLHAAWDSGLIHADGQTAEDLVNNLNRATFGVDQSADARGTYTEWAMASFALAKEIVYPQVDGDGRITEPERGLAMSVIEDQIRLAGVRLAAVLNRALGTPDVPAPR